MGDATMTFQLSIPLVVLAITAISILVTAAIKLAFATRDSAKNAEGNEAMSKEQVKLRTELEIVKTDVDTAHKNQKAMQSEIVNLLVEMTRLQKDVESLQKAKH